MAMVARLRQLVLGAGVPYNSLFPKNPREDLSSLQTLFPIMIPPASEMSPLRFA